ncbi:hypothetical protein [Algoriphagus litoralis]|nr:hypothetical protein [Algoriphagus litoralis]
MSKRQATILWTIFLVVLIGVLVHWFFEKKEIEIKKNIQEIESQN